MGSKNKPGMFDCYANAEPDEPMFVLLGRDKHAPQLVEMWAGQRAAEGEDPTKVEEALKCAKAMRRYRYDRKGAPECEYCEASDDAACLKISSYVVTETNFVHFFACKARCEFLHPNGGARTIEEYFATDEVHNDYINDEALRMFHATNAIAAEAESEDGPVESTVVIEETVRLILRDCPFWAPEVRVDNLLPYLRRYGDPLYDALMRLSEDERKGCGVDRIVVKKLG